MQQTTAVLALWRRVEAFREKNALVEIAVFFLGGFAFDVLTLDRIDSAFNMAQQGAYLALLFVLLGLEQRREVAAQGSEGLAAKLWSFREDALHFLLGSLLSGFSLFYFKSASGLSALAFMLVTFAVLVFNELPRFRKLGHVGRVGLFAFCVTTYLSYVIPIAFGFLSAWLFLLSALGAGLAGGALGAWVAAARGRNWTLRSVIAPYGGVVAVMLVTYFAGAVPPIPVHAQKLGIYHEVAVEKGEDGQRQYRLMHERDWWRPWQRGDQHFRARSGDRAYVFISVFAPTRFADAVEVRWHYKEGKGFSTKGTRLSVLGGRDGGFRTFAYLPDPKPGRWKVEVLTVDGRTIGEIGFTVEEDPSTAPRTFFEERY